MAVRRKRKAKVEEAPPPPPVPEPVVEPGPEPEPSLEEKLVALVPDLDATAGETGQSIYARFADNIRNYFGGIDD